jgi:hypothetical protein
MAVGIEWAWWSEGSWNGEERLNESEGQLESRVRAAGLSSNVAHSTILYLQIRHTRQSVRALIVIAVPLSARVPSGEQSSHPDAPLPCCEGTKQPYARCRLI